MGKEFAKRIQNFNCNKVNIFPLLHSCICRGKFLKAHKQYCEGIKEINGKEFDNYFVATGKMISEKIIKNIDKFNCYKSISLK